MLSVPGAAVGRRKQAIARVRLVPGSGTITVNGRTIEDYFPNKLHQQLINDPFTVLELAGSYDVIARISGGGPSGQPARCAWASPARSTRSTPRTTARPQEGRLPLARRSRQGAQEGRSQEGPQGASVLQALSSTLRMPLFGTDGVRGLANGLLTAELALHLAQATAVVLGQGRSAEARKAEGRRLTAVVARDPRVSGGVPRGRGRRGPGLVGCRCPRRGRHPHPRHRFPHRRP